MEFVKVLAKKFNKNTCCFEGKYVVEGFLVKWNNFYVDIQSKEHGILRYGLQDFIFVIPEEAKKENTFRSVQDWINEKFINQIAKDVKDIENGTPNDHLKVHAHNKSFFDKHKNESKGYSDEDLIKVENILDEVNRLKSEKKVLQTVNEGLKLQKKILENRIANLESIGKPNSNLVNFLSK